MIPVAPGWPVGAPQSAGALAHCSRFRARAPALPTGPRHTSRCLWAGCCLFVGRLVGWFVGRLFGGVSCEDALDFLQPLVLAAVSHHPAEFLALAVDQHHRRETATFVLHLELLVLLFHRIRLRLVLGEIEFEQDEFLGRPILEFLRVEHILLQLDAEPAPVAAGEVGQHDLLVGLGLGDGGLVLR